MKTLKKFYLPVFLLFMSSNYVVAQGKSKITGSVIDGKQKPVEFATVNLLNPGDSSLVKTTVTTEQGNYKFEIAAPAKFIVSVTAVGYKKGSSKEIELIEQQDVKVPEIVLTADSKTLKEVTITGKKPFIEKRADKTIVNVEGSSVAVGNTALEVLQKAPGVNVDKDGNISLNGKNGVLVMMDGKPTYMSNEDLANVLRGMQSSQIENIELITNPSAKYDAAGQAGIINIKTKRGKNAGFNGSVTAGTGYGRTSKYNGSTNLNFRKGKLNVFGNYNYSNNGNINNFELNRKVDTNNVTTNFDQINGWNSRRDNNGYKAGVDYYVSKNTTIGLLINGYNNSVNERAKSGTSIFNQFAKIDSSIDVTGRNRQHFSNNAYNFNFKTTFDTIGRELSVDADYSQYNGRMDEFRDSYYTNFKNNQGPEFINNLAPADINVKSAKLDYAHPVNKTLKFETGLKSSWVTTDNNLQFSGLANNTWVNDTSRSNHFIYKENINAGYVNASKQFKTTSVQVGLRAEHTNSNGNSLTKNKVVKRDYIEFFPSISLSQKLGKDHQLGTSVSRRIDRPSYDNLNPFVYILDKYTSAQGNPYLNPQFTKSAELSYTYQGKATATLSYSKTTDVMTEITEQDDATSKTFVQQRNIDNQTIYSLNIFAPIPLQKWWAMNNNVQVFNMGFKADIFGERLNVNQTVFQINNDNQFTISKTVGAELSFWYMSPLQYGIFQIRNSPFVNIGLKKSFNNNKINAKLNLNDVFNSMQNRGKTKYANMDFNFNNKWESRVANFSISYRFGSNDIKPQRERKTGLESEAGRMKN